MSVLALADGTPLADSDIETFTPQTPRVRAVGTAAIYTTAVTLSTYPYASCLLPSQTGVAGVSYHPLDWDCLSAAGAPVPQTYTLLVLSNDYLTVTLLPELGGRVYEVIFKPTGNNELYRNPVLKPTRWGPPEQGWWLAAGGLEWGFPTDEHGYEWGMPWHYRIESTTGGVTVTLRDSDAANRPNLEVALHLPPDRAVLVVSFRIANQTSRYVGVKYWTNAMLAPGASNTPSADLRFLFPADQVTVHSTGDPSLPAPGALMDWPVYNGRDYSRLGNWDRYLGFFEAPQARGPFAGVYDLAADEGMLRIFPAALARGSKGFGLGWNDRLSSDLWTDDGSAYVEVHGGLEPTFWDTATLAPGQVVSWTEVWYPLAGIGGVSAATEEAALRLERVNDTLAVGLYTPALYEDVSLYLWQNDCTSVGRWRFPRVDPAHPIVIRLPASGLEPDDLHLVVLSANGTLLAGVNPKDCLPPEVAIEPLPFYVTTADFVVNWHGVDSWSGIADYDVQVRSGYEGDWVTWLAATSAVSATYNGADGQTYFFRARGRDTAHNTGLFAEEEWGQAFTSVLLSPSPVLVTSRKLAHPLKPARQQPVTCTVLLSNTGNVTATSIVLTDHLPATLSLVSGTLKANGEHMPMPAGDLITWHGDLPSRHEFRITYALSPTSETPLGVRLANTLWLEADGLVPLMRRSFLTYYQFFYLPLSAISPTRP